MTHHVSATHKQNLPLSFSLLNAPTNMNIDPTSGHLEWTADANSAGTYAINLVINDGQGGKAVQTFNLIVCAPPAIWASYQCEGPISFMSIPPGNGGYYGMDIGQTYTYQATTTHKQNLPVTYSLEDAPASMMIDSNSGNLVWTADMGSAGTYTVSILANDGQGGVTKQSAYLIVCAASTHWSQDNYECQ